MSDFIKIADTAPAGSYAEKVRRHLDSLEGRQGAMKLAVAEELWQALESTGTTKAELARRAGTSPQYITKVFRGTTNFTLESLVGLFYHVGHELEITAQPKAGVVANALSFRPASAMDYANPVQSYQPSKFNGSFEERLYDPSVAA